MSTVKIFVLIFYLESTNVETNSQETKEPFDDPCESWILNLMDT